MPCTRKRRYNTNVGSDVNASIQERTAEKVEVDDRMAALVKESQEWRERVKELVRASLSHRMD